jgi:hypothetical protein
MTEKASNNPSIAFLTDEIHLVLSLACTFKEELGGVVIVTVLVTDGEKAPLFRRYLRRYIGLSCEYFIRHTVYTGELCNIWLNQILRYIAESRKLCMSLEYANF